LSTNYCDGTIAPSPGPVLVRYYANLKLPYGTGLDTVRRAWRRLIKK